MSLSKETTVAIVAGSAVAVAAAAAWCAYRNKSSSSGPPKKWKKVGELTQLWCYPIKSCGVISLKEAECARLGLKSGLLRDRVLMVTGLDYSFKTARTYPNMTLVQPRIDGDVIHLSAPGMPEVKFALGSLTKEVVGKVWDQDVKVLDCGDEVATWLSKYILNAESGCRLVYYPLENSTRTVRPKNKIFKKTQDKDNGALPDASSYMLLNEASVVDLNTRLPTGSKPCTSLQFRPNFCVRGVGLRAYEEDKWEWVKIGETIFQVVKPCTRCVFTNINPKTGEKDPNNEPLTTLKSYRQIRDPVLRPHTGDSPVLGQHVVVFKEGPVHHGDSVFIGA